MTFQLASFTVSARWDYASPRIAHTPDGSQAFFQIPWEMQIRTGAAPSWLAACNEFFRSLAAQLVINLSSVTQGHNLCGPTGKIPAQVVAVVVAQHTQRKRFPLTVVMELLHEAGVRTGRSRFFQTRGPTWRYQRCLAVGESYAG